MNKDNKQTVRKGNKIGQEEGNRQKIKQSAENRRKTINIIDRT